MSVPLTTVVIPSYNHASYVRTAIESVLAQHCARVQLIIIDDGSSDGSPELIAEVVSKCRGLWIEFIHRENRGLVPTINEGLHRAEGEFFAVLASDDFWHQEKLAIQTECMRKAPSGTGACFSDCYVIDSKGSPLGLSSQRARLRGGTIYHDVVFHRFVPPSPTSLFVRDALLDVGCFDEALPAEDYNAWVRVARKYRVEYIPKPLAFYRLHETNMTRVRGDATTAALERTVAWLLEHDPSLRRYARVLESRVQSHAAAVHLHKREFALATSQASAALRMYPLDRMAWRILASALIRRVVNL